MTVDPPRPLTRRIADTRHLLEVAVDAWVATADPETGRPWMVPLSFAWTGSALVLGSTLDSRTFVNLARQPWVRLGIGAVRDVALVHGRGRILPSAELPGQEADRFAERAGFDPRRIDGYGYARIVPRRIQAWREENELAERDIMRAGQWLESS